jgi:hypothetical protein
VLIVMKIVGWAQCVSGGSLGLGTGVGQSLCLWLVAVVDLLEGGWVSKHHWETVTMMVGRIACGLVSSGKLLMSLLRSAVQVVWLMANARAQVGLEDKLGIVGMLTENYCIHVGSWKGWLFQEKMRGKLGSSKSI